MREHAETRGDGEENYGVIAVRNTVRMVFDARKMRAGEGIKYSARWRLGGTRE